MFKLSPKGREQTLMIMGPGEPVGEVAVLSGEAYPASAETLEPSEALYIPRQAFLDLVSREPEVAMRLLSALSARLRSFASLIEDLSLRDVSERLAAHLLSLAPEGDSEQIVDLGVSKSSAVRGCGHGARDPVACLPAARPFGGASRPGAARCTSRTGPLLRRVARVR